MPNIKRAAWFRACAVGTLAAAVVGNITACSSSAGKASGQSGSGAFHLTIADLSSTTSKVPVYAAKDEGFFAKNGLNVTISSFSGGGSSGIPALASGSAQMALTGATDMASAVASGALKAKYVAEVLGSNYDIVTTKSISSISDLAGKKIGISGTGSSDQAFLLGTFKAYGVDTSGMTFLTVGPPDARLASIGAGKIQATAYTSTTRNHASAVAKVLLRADDNKIAFPNSMVAASDDLINSHPDVIKAFVKSLDEASAWVRNDANIDAYRTVCEKYAKATADACTEARNYVIDSKDPYSWSSTGRMDVAGLKDSAKSAALINPKLSGFDMSTVIDTSFTSGASQ